MNFPEAFYRKMYWLSLVMGIAGACLCFEHREVIGGMLVGLAVATAWNDGRYGK